MGPENVHPNKLSGDPDATGPGATLLKQLSCLMAITIPPTPPWGTNFSVLEGAVDWREPGKQEFGPTFSQTGH